MVVSGNVSKRDEIDSMIVSKSASSNFVLPGPTGNRVSQVNSSGVPSTWKEIEPGVCPTRWMASSPS